METNNLSKRILQVRSNNKIDLIDAINDQGIHASDFEIIETKKYKGTDIKNSYFTTYTAEISLQVFHLRKYIDHFTKNKNFRTNVKLSSNGFQ